MGFLKNIIGTMKHKQKSKRKNPQRRAAEKKKEIGGLSVDQVWLDEASSIPENVELKTQVLATYFDFSPKQAETPNWVKDIVQSYFKRAEHGI
jgi:hypothetical protein